MSRKVFVKILVDVVLNADEDVDISELVSNDIVYNIYSENSKADIEDVQYSTHEVTDSK